MGAYNTISAFVPCPRCGASVEVTVQFKYGDTWQYSYHIFDKLKWGGNDFGESGAHRVVVDGVAEQCCPACGFDEEWNFYIYLEDDKIVAVEPANGKYNFVATNNTYIVLQQ